MTEPRKWFEFAREDLVLAEVALEKGIYNQTCFHAQQGVEKALKGYLRNQKRSLPKTHALSELLAICRKLDNRFSEIEEGCLKLDRYYIPTRYPDALPGTRGSADICRCGGGVDALKRHPNLDPRESLTAHPSARSYEGGPA